MVILPSEYSFTLSAKYWKALPSTLSDGCLVAMRQVTSALAALIVKTRPITIAMDDRVRFNFNTLNLLS